MRTEETVTRSFTKHAGSLFQSCGKILTDTDRYLSAFDRNDFQFSLSNEEKKNYHDLFRLFSHEVLIFCENTERDAARLSALVCIADRLRAPELTRKIADVLEAYYAAMLEICGFLKDAEAYFADDFKNFNNAKLLGSTRKFKSVIETLMAAIKI